MLFIPENELERALVRAVKEPHAVPDFYRLLLSSDLLVLGSVEGHENDTEVFNAAPGSNIRLVTGQKDGGQYLPIFSSLARMQEYVKQQSNYLSVNGRALLDLTRGAPIILNPASEYGKELTPDQVKQLLDGPGGKLRALSKGERPPALVDMLTALFAGRPEIETAWMLEVNLTDNPAQAHPLVSIETTSATQAAAQRDWSSLMEAIQAAAEQSVPGLMFDVQRFDRGSLGVAHLSQAEPFYRRAAADPAVN